jgi:hypothetical protein
MFYRAKESDVNRAASTRRSPGLAPAGAPMLMTSAPAVAPALRGVPAIKSLTPAGVLQLQRAVGNRATGRLLSRRAARNKENETGLPGDLKAGIENLSGVAVDDVKVHYDSPEPARLQALAYTRGADIYVAPGQEKHLPHEAWHVVQQKRGQAKPTLLVKGEAVNDDDGLEREADRMGEMAARVGDADAPLGPLEDTPAATGTELVQRRVGFEFESVTDSKWRFQGRNNDLEHWAGIAHTKEILLFTKSGNAGAGADNGVVEFITKPLSDWETVAGTMSELEKMVETLRNKTTVLTDPENDKARAITGLAQHRIVASNTFLARPQATIGVSALSIPELFTALLRMNKGGGPTESDAPLEFDPVVANKTLAYQLGVSLNASGDILKTAFSAAKLDFGELKESVRGELIGFLSVILKTLWDAYSNSGSELTDPKYAFPLMFRTDFVSMLNTLQGEAQKLFRDLWNDGHLKKAINEMYGLDEPVFPGGYTGADKKRHKGPTKNEWIESIVSGGDPKDLMSPPPTFPRHNTMQRPEGLGAYTADQDLLLFELRELMGLGSQPPEKWVDIAMAVCRLVAKTEGDAKLDPPVIVKAGRV